MDHLEAETRMGGYGTRSRGIRVDFGSATFRPRWMVVRPSPMRPCRRGPLVGGRARFEPWPKHHVASRLKALEGRLVITPNAPR